MRALLVLALFFLVNLSGMASAQTLTPQAALERLLTERPAKAEWFSDTFLAQVPLDQLKTILRDIMTAWGNYQSVQPRGSKFEVQLERATMLSSVALDDQGKFIGLFFEPPVPSMTNVDEVIAEFKALPGEVNVLVLKDDEEVVSYNADTPLAVGSTFKLAILNVLQQQINEGKHTWDEVVALDPQWKSLPSGILQDWPDGSELTLETLATLMISQSDNTATDALLAIVGRENVEALSQRNRPFLDTREAFTLKDPQNQALLEQFIKADEATKRQLLTAIQDAPLAANFVWNEPKALEVEWYFTPRELCDLMSQ
jgi:beta-lactamase class A